MSTFTTLKTITGIEIKVRPNNSKRTYTIKTQSGSKYRTVPMSKEDFNNSYYWTGNDWQNFLRTDECYKV